MIPLDHDARTRLLGTHATLIETIPGLVGRDRDLPVDDLNRLADALVNALEAVNAAISDTYGEADEALASLSAAEGGQP